VSLLLDVHLPQGGSVPLGYAVLIALAYLAIYLLMGSP